MAMEQEKLAGRCEIELQSFYMCAFKSKVLTNDYFSIK